MVDESDIDEGLETVSSPLKAIVAFGIGYWIWTKVFTDLLPHLPAIAGIMFGGLIAAIVWRDIDGNIV